MEAFRLLWDLFRWPCLAEAQSRFWYYQPRQDPTWTGAQNLARRVLAERGTRFAE